MEKKYLLIGCRSKIAKRFIEAAPSSFILDGTVSTKTNRVPGISNQFTVDLSKVDEVAAFTDTIKDTAYDGILFFASTYNKDHEDKAAYNKQLVSDLQINALSILQIAKNANLQNDARIIMFGDSGLHQPRGSYTSYEMSKSLVESITKSLAIELPSANVLCFRLGPVLADESRPDKAAYYARNVKRVADPAAGLVNLLLFSLSEQNLGMSGCLVDYDGATYLRR